MDKDNSTFKKISSFLSEKEIKPSYQRVRIMERLWKALDHPTVNDIYGDLIDSIPSLSKTTVYNTLNLFLEKGIIKSFSIEGNEARYDIIQKNHGHFFCMRCKMVYDFEIQDQDFFSHSLDNFEVLEKEITLKGICSLCRSKKA